MTERRTRRDRRLVQLHPLADELREALAAGDIALRIQPQFAVATGRLVGAEALVHWNHPAKGNISGETLFAIAAKAGLDEALSQHVLARSMAEAAHWPDHLALSVNITAADLARGSLVETVEAALAASGLDPGRLVLEITEQALVDELEHSAAQLEQLHARGIGIALDDFGAGFCNFRYLKLLPLDGLKLDRSMVEGIADDPRDLAVLRGILAMARALSLKVTVEGIETEAQRQIIAAEGCDHWQGFLGAAPMDPEAFKTFAGA